MCLYPYPLVKIPQPTACHSLGLKRAAGNCCIFSRLPLFKKQLLHMSRHCVSEVPSPSCSRRQKCFPRMVGILEKTCTSHTLGALGCYSYNLRIALLSSCLGHVPIVPIPTMSLLIPKAIAQAGSRDRN